MIVFIVITLIIFYIHIILVIVLILISYLIVETVSPFFDTLFADLPLFSNRAINKTIEFNCYPNPFKQTLNLSLPNDSGELNLRDLNGKLWINAKSDARNYSIDLELLPAGIYLMEYHFEGKSGIKKVVKF
jgi:hypothetical protein